MYSASKGLILARLLDITLSIVFSGALRCRMLQGPEVAKPQNSWGSPPAPAVPPTRKAHRARLATVGDCQSQAARLFREARSGILPVQDAARLANILALISRMIEGGEFEKRLEMLETRAAA